jgi:hypothetical protein
MTNPNYTDIDVRKVLAGGTMKPPVLKQPAKQPKFKAPVVPNITSVKL